jgi:hypothetical protein
MRAPARRAVVLGLSGLCACASTPSWRAVGGAAPAATLRESPGALRTPLPLRVWVTGWPDPVLVRAPQVVADSLVGTRVATLRDDRGPRIAVPLAAVAGVDEARIGGSGGEKAVVVVAGLIALLGAGYALLAATWTGG